MNKRLQAARTLGARTGFSGTLSFDPVEEARRRWESRGLDDPTAMAAAISIMRAAEIVSSGFESALRPFGLTYSRYQVLGLLSFSRTGDLAMGKMAARWQLHPATLTSIVDRLESDDLVGRSIDPSDRRSYLVAITDKGREIFETATAAVAEMGFGVEGLSSAQQENLIGIIRSLRQNYGDFSDPDS